MNQKNHLKLAVLFGFFLNQPAFASAFSDSIVIDKAASVETFIGDNQVAPKDAPQSGTLVGINIKPNISVSFGQNWQAYFEGQLYSATNGTYIDSEDKETQSNDFAGLRELWVGYKGWTSYPGETFHVGLERKRINDGIILDAPLLGASWNFDTSLLQTMVGYGEQHSNLRTGDYTLPASVEDLKLSYLQSRFQYYSRHAASAYAIHGDGHSNPLDTNLTWAGIALDNGYYSDKSAPGLSYSLSAHAVSGEQADLPGAAINDVKGYARDIGLRWQFNGDWTKTIGLQFAEASGGAEGYRTTDLETNRSKFTGSGSVLYRFNEALRADFRNLDAITVYGSLAQFKQWNANIVYNRFSIHDSGEPYYISGRAKPVSADITTLGQGLDIVFTGFLHRKGPSLFALKSFDSSVRLRLSAFTYNDAMEDQVPRKNLYSANLSWIIQL